MLQLVQAAARAGRLAAARAADDEGVLGEAAHRQRDQPVRPSDVTDPDRGTVGLEHHLAGGRRSCQADYGVNVKRITPVLVAGIAPPARICSGYMADVLGFFHDPMVWRGEIVARCRQNPSNKPCRSGGYVAPRGSAEDPKVTALRESRRLNPHPEQVTDPGFLAGGFFDARDAMQVKYEMVRRVMVNGEPVTAAAAAFGYSRPSYYQAAAALAESGLEGLVPARPGPRGGHKLTGEILAWAQEQLEADPALRPAALTGPIAVQFGVRVHPRSIERALARFRERSKR
jgi:transposase